jgi:hypothetical protein
MVFGDVKPYGLVNEYQHVGETFDSIFSLEDVCCLNNEAAPPTETLVLIYQTVQSHLPD